VKVFSQEDSKCMLLGACLNNYDELLLLCGESNTEHIRGKTKLPQLYIRSSSLFSIYYDYFTKLDYDLILNYEIAPSISIKKSEGTHNKTRICNKIAIPFKNDLLFESVDTLYFNRAFYNSSHSLIKFYISNSDVIENNENVYKKWGAIFKFIENVYGYEPATISLSELNSLIGTVTLDSSINLSLTTKDFPKRFHNMVISEQK